MSKRSGKELGGFRLVRRPESPFWYIRSWDTKARAARWHSTGCTDIGAAEQKLAEHVLRHEELERERAEDVPLLAILERYLHGHVPSTTRAEATEAHIALWREHFGDRPISELKIPAQEALIGKLRAVSYSDGYIRDILGTARTALRWAHRRGDLASVPYIMTTERGPARERVLTLAEAAALFNAATTEHFWRFLILAFGTAARPRAILELTRAQVDFRNRRLDLNPAGRRRTKKGRPVLPICDTLLHWLEQSGPGYVIQWKKVQSEPLGRIQSAFETARKRAGLGAEVTAYTIRHTVGTELRKRGVPPWEAAGFMGHKLDRYSTTEIYAKWQPDYLGAAARAVEDYFRELAPLVNRPLLGDELEEQPTVSEVLASTNPPLRTTRAPLVGNVVAQVFDYMVGVTGFEPATPTSRTAIKDSEDNDLADPE